MVATDNPLATSAGIDALRAGGSAMDAALAAAAAIAVTQPDHCQIGGDLFLLTYEAATGTVRAINASGVAPGAATAEHYRGMGEIPLRGPLACAGPGCVAGWERAHARWGRLPWGRLFNAAIDYAEGGFPVSPRLALLCQSYTQLLQSYPATAAAFLPDGVPPRAGATLRQPALAATLRTLAAQGPRALLEGDLARRIAAAFRKAGGLLDEADLAATEAEELDPARSTYRGFTVYEQPPVSQGFIVLEALNILEGFDLAAMSPGERIHHLAEALKLAFEDRYAHLGDPRVVDVPLDRLTSKEHARERAAELDPAAPRPFSPPDRYPVAGDTTYLCTMDAEGNAVSLIQSIFSPWGSAFVAGDTGILFNNRLTGFSLEPGHPNELAPGKRTAHTLNTYLLTRDGKAALVGGTPGADRQVQTNVQVLTNIVDLGLDPQAAVDAPRWSVGRGQTLELEEGFPEAVRAELAARGHTLTSLGAWFPLAGRAQLIAVDPESNARVGASDPRGEGQAQGF
jgi:gamma-glutamyltranspeptidase/glutathione hydrolase